MVIRTPNPSINIPKIDAEKIPQPIQWHSLKCKLVTPMYGGGVKSTVVDTDMPIRVTGIRGQLRFWWRLLATQKWYKSDTTKQIKEKEFALWGGMNDGDEDGKAGLVLLRVKDFNNINVQKWAEYILHKKEKRSKKNNGIQLQLQINHWKGLSYVLFPAQGKLKDDRTKVEEEPHSLLKEGLTWRLDVAFAPQITKSQKEQVIETIRWWATFGGVGSRTRRGLGSFQVTQADNFQITECINFQQVLVPVSKNEVENYHLKIANTGTNRDAIKALETAIKQLQTFRQNINAETKTFNNSKEKVKDKEFPIATFGLPIISEDTSKSIEPLDPDNKMGRMSSPLIVKAVPQDGQWKGTALLLPYEHIEDKKIEVNHQEYKIKKSHLAKLEEFVKKFPNHRTQG